MDDDCNMVGGAELASLARPLLLVYEFRKFRAVKGVENTPSKALSGSALLQGLGKCFLFYIQFFCPASQEDQGKKGKRDLG